MIGKVTDMTENILIVDDSKVDVIMIQSILSDYNLQVAYDGMEALNILEKNPNIDLMILDLNMPKMNGFEVLEIVQRVPQYQKIVTLILTNSDELESEIKGLDLGAVDYIRKPLNLESLRKRIEIHVKLKNVSHQLAENNAILEKTVEKRTNELVLTRNITIQALAGLLEARDIECCNHTKRTQLMVEALCEQLSQKPAFSQVLTEHYVKEIVETVPLHDIGKVGIPDKILLKPGKLDEEEFKIMQQHVILGTDAIKYEVQDIEVPDFIKTAIDCIGGHHEKYDGSGYPVGLKGEDIPLPGRLMAIADVYDAIISKRVYKEALGQDVALEYIKTQKGLHFDPHIVDAFLEIEAQIQQIVLSFKH